MTNIDKIQNSFLENMEYMPSPFCDDRPLGTEIDTIVIHNISLPPGEFGTHCISQFFCGKLDFESDPYFQTIAHLRVSAHLLIDRNGKVIQFVPFDKRAWHAGQSFFKGRERCNDFSIGIELEGTDTLPFEDIQYVKLISIIKTLQKAYPKIKKDHIVGHSDIAPGRKTDPGPLFDWHRIHCESFC